MPKSKDRTEESKNGELGLIIDEFGRAMFSANREYIAQTNGNEPRMTMHMAEVWWKYVEFCQRYPK